MNQERSRDTYQDTPWGSWQVLDDSDICKVKKICVKPGKRLSYQKHFKREEFWILVQGEAEVILDGKFHLLKTGESILIPKQSAHRIANNEKNSENIIFIEIQRGDDFAEDDIVRLEDDYGRV